MTHDEIVSSVTTAILDIDRDEVVKSFLASLSTRDLKMRSLFGSFLVLQNFKTHSFSPSNMFSTMHCANCGMKNENNKQERLERIEKYPFQIQHTDIVYSGYDLKNAGDRLGSAPKDKDIHIFRSMIERIGSQKWGQSNFSCFICLHDFRNITNKLHRVFYRAQVFKTPERCSLAHADRLRLVDQFAESSKGYIWEGYALPRTRPTNLPAHIFQIIN